MASDHSLAMRASGFCWLSCRAMRLPRNLQRQSVDAEEGRVKTGSETAIPRRRFIGGAASVGFGALAAAMVGCGDDDDGAAPTVGSAPTTVPRTSTAAPTKGGVLKLHAFNGPTAADPQKTIGILGSLDLWSAVASTLLRLDWRDGNKNHTGSGRKMGVR